MKPIEFEESNVTFAKDQPEYNTLPCLRTESGQLLICWKLSWRERWQVLTKGVVWHTIQTFGQALQPQMMEAVKPCINYAEPSEEQAERDVWEAQKRKAIREREEAGQRRYNIPINGLDPAACLAALFNAAKPAQGVMFSDDVMTRDEADKILTDLSNTPGRNQYVDTIHGRVIRCHFGRECIRPHLYDEANGPDWAIKSLMPLLPKKSVEDAGFPL